MRAFALTLLLCTGLLAAAQQHAFRQITARDGLAQSQVRAIAQDGDGYLWFGTLGGASRYDGHGFANISLNEGLPDAQVSALARLPDGSLWLGSGNAIVRIDGNRLAVEELPSVQRASRVMGLAADAQGSLFIGTDGDGLLVRAGGRIGPVEGYPSDTATHVRCLLMLRDGSLLVGLRNGLLRCAAGRCERITVGDAEPKLINALAEDREGGWWVGTLGNGVYRFAPHGAVTEFDEESGLLQNNVRCLLVDDRDRVWIGTKLGLNQYDGQRMRTFTVHQGLPNDNIQCAYQDHEGNLWFGTDGAGVLRYLGDRLVTFTVKDGLCSDLVMSITPDARGDLWLGTYDNGLCRLDGMAMLTTRDGLPNNTVWCGLLDQDSSLWFGTSDGLVHLRRGEVIPEDSGRTLPGARVLALLRDRAGTIWCGARDGLHAVRGDSVQHYTEDDAGPIRSVRALVEEADGLLLATDDGLIRFRHGRFSRLGAEQGLPDKTALCLSRDQAGRTWIGTANGLSCLTADGFRNIRLGSDFGSNYINLLLPDGDGQLWAGTNNGLYAFMPDSLLADPANREHLTMNDGLRGQEFNLNAALAWRSGRLLFGSAAGLVLYDAQRGLDDQTKAAPSVRITGVRSFLQQTDWKGASDSLDHHGLPVGLHLSYRRHYLTFDYSAISFARPEDVRYRYRLVGLDSEWLPATEARFASYGNLPHGGYTFEVSAAVGKGPWSAPASLSFVIDPPFWAKWWFYLLCLVLLAAAAFGVHRYRAIRRERREKTRQLMLRSRMLQLEQQALNANMNRHFVFNALNSIQFHINRQDRATASRYLTSFAKLIRKNLDASQGDTTSLAEELDRLELYLKLEHMRFKDKFRYAIEVDPAINLGQVQLPAMMLQPYVENSIWHGILPMQEQGLVTIRVQPAQDPSRVAVVIEDDGIGVDQSLKAKQPTEGDHISRGIEITKGRADVLRRLDLTDIRIDGPRERQDPASGRVLGTTVTIELPVQQMVKNSVEGLQSATSAPTFEQS